MNKNILKSLFLFKNGENKGFLELMQHKRNDGVVEDAIDKFIERRSLIVSDNDLDTIKELHDLCVGNPSIDSELANHVDSLYKNIYQKSSRYVGGN